MLFFCQTDNVCSSIIDKLLQRIIVDPSSSNNIDAYGDSGNNSNAALRLLQILISKRPSIFMKNKYLSKIELHLEELPI